MAHKKRKRLDEAMAERGLVESAKMAAGYIMAREVKVNGQIVDQAGTAIKEGDEISMVSTMPWVSRGGYKLSGVLEKFGINPSGRTCADVGACTGGFTDVLLQNGATKVYALDVGYGLIDWKLRQDERVVVMERTNVRYVEALDEPVSLVVIDVSFISLKIILPAIRKWLQSTAESTAEVVALIKPQFEAARDQVGKGGIVRDDAVREEIVVDVLSWLQERAWTINNLAESSIKGTEGNIEFLVHITPCNTPGDNEKTLKDAQEWYRSLYR